jgi:flagellar biosynthesis/type III secretory pathway chaperone
MDTMPAPQDCIENAYRCFDEIANLYKKLLDLSMKEKELIIYEDLKTLTETIIEKEELMNAISVQKDEVKEQMDGVKTGYGYQAGEEVPVMRLIKLFPGDWTNKFEMVFARLREYTSSIRTVAMVNRRLIADTVKFINYVVNFMKKGEGEMTVYSQKGFAVKKSNELNFLDVKL